MTDDSAERTSPPQNAQSQVVNSFRKVLDSHGYGFQYAVLESARALAKNNLSPWLFEASELPVPPDAKIDFLLRHSQRPRLLVAECKRANPALGAWCFARAPYVARNVSEVEAVVLEVVVRRDHDLASVRYERVTHSRDVYHIGVEVKLHGKPAARLSPQRQSQASHATGARGAGDCPPHPHGVARRWNLRRNRSGTQPGRGRLKARLVLARCNGPQDSPAPGLVRGRSEGLLGAHLIRGNGRIRRERFLRVYQVPIYSAYTSRRAYTHRASG